jgi:hypothetical protein
VLIGVAQPAVAEPPLLIPVDGKPYHASLTAIDAEERVAFEVEGKTDTLPMKDIVSWGQCVEQSRGAALIFADGGILAADMIAADQETLSIDSELFGTQKISLESLRGIVLRLPADRKQRDAMHDHIMQATGESDRLLLENGDEVSGLLLGLENDQFKLDTDGGKVDVDVDKVVAVVFNPSLVHPAAQDDSLHVWIGLSDGSRLLTSHCVFDKTALEITTAGQTWKTTPDRLAFLQPIGGRAIYLSDLKPADYRQTPYLDLPWPYGTDRDVTGGLLRCRGRLFLKGLGVHSHARLVYALDALEPNNTTEPTHVPPKQFCAEAAVGDSSAGRGSVRFRVVVDGQEKYAGPIVRGGDAPTPIDVDLTGGKKLELIVDYADQADILDRAAWLNARLTW